MSYQYPESGGGWHEPGSGGGGSGPYGSAGGGYGSGYGGGFGPPPPPPYTDPYMAPPDKTSTIWALVVSIISVVFCCLGTNVIGIVFAAIGLSKDREPEEMERMTRWSWISTGIHVAVGVVLFVVWLMFVIWAESQPY